MTSLKYSTSSRRETFSGGFLATGMFDSFYDEDSECPKCRVKVKGGWQTKQLESLLESWKKGDFFQYRKLVRNPDWKPEQGAFGLLKRLDDPIENKPIMESGKIPVHASCATCDAWLEACAKIIDGRFVGIVEVEADGREKELVMMNAGTTAESLREEFNRKLILLQESCRHEETRWMNVEQTSGHFSGRRLICLRCERMSQMES